MNDYRALVQGDGSYNLPKNRWKEGETQVPGTISWEEHLEVWEKYNEKYTGQSAEKIAARGGFGFFEAQVYLGRPLRTWCPR